MKKRIYTAILAALMVLALCGCYTFAVTNEANTASTVPTFTRDTSPVAETLVAMNTEPADFPILNKEPILEKWEPGFHVIDGVLFYADENWDLLCDGQLGTLTFDEKGRYTSGNAELDAIVTELLAGFYEENPSASRYDILYEAFCYCRDEFRYVGRGILDFGATGWEVEWALEALQTKATNCYGFNAAFCQLARGLGYDAYCVSGKVLELAMPHGWCECEIDGELFIFDPQLAYRALTGERTNWGEDMFQVPMWEAWSWRYIWPD